MTKTNNLLTFENVNYFYQTKTAEIFALNSVNFEIEKQHFVSLVGPSGCGKTTILSLSAGLLKPSTGTILLDGESKIDTKKIGYMFQRDHLFEWRTVWKNITLGLEIQKPKNLDQKLKLAEDLLKKYDLYSFKDTKPRSLSGGMRQRVALIRTLVLDPDILLLDEPFSALDEQTKLLVNEDIYKIVCDVKKSVIMVTHDIAEAIAFSDRVLVLSKRPSSVKKIYEISFENLRNRTPLNTRNQKEFKEYFDSIWRDLNEC